MLAMIRKIAVSMICLLSILGTNAINAHAGKASKQKFDCIIEGNISYTVFDNKYGERKVIKWVSKNRKANVDRCKSFAMTMNESLLRKGNVYMIPGYTTTKEPALCVSNQRKNRKTQDTVCSDRNVLAKLITNSDPNVELRSFYKTSFLFGNKDPLSQSNSALKNDENGEPYIDMRKAITDSAD
jgi:Circadian oscillating protein COP23